MKSFKEFLLESVDTKKLGKAISLVKKISKTLPSNCKNAVTSWSHGTLASSGNALEDPTVLKTLEHEFKPARELLKTLFGSHIELYRGETDRSEENTKHSSGREIYSWTASPKIAAMHANHSKLFPEYSDDDIKKALNQFNLKGVSKLGTYKVIKSKDGKYFNLYQNKNYLTGYDIEDIEDVLSNIQKDNKESNDRLKKNQGKVYNKLIPIDDIVWIVDAMNFKELEFIVKGGDRLK